MFCSRNLLQNHLCEMSSEFYLWPLLVWHLFLDELPYAQVPTSHRIQPLLLSFLLSLFHRAYTDPLQCSKSGELSHHVSVVSIGSELCNRAWFSNPSCLLLVLCAPQCTRAEHHTVLLLQGKCVPHLSYCPSNMPTLPPVPLFLLGSWSP